MSTGKPGENKREKEVSKKGPNGPSDDGRYMKGV